MAVSTFPQPQDLDLLAIEASIPQHIAKLRRGEIVYVPCPTSGQPAQPTLVVFVVDVPVILKNGKTSAHSIVWPLSASPIDEAVPLRADLIDPDHKKQMCDYAAGFTAIDWRYKSAKTQVLQKLFASHFQA